MATACRGDLWGPWADLLVVGEAARYDVGTARGSLDFSDKVAQVDLCVGLTPRLASLADA